MSRTTVTTGAASGIGKATVDLLTERGERVIGVDIHDADIVADLGTAAIIEDEPSPDRGNEYGR